MFSLELKPKASPSEPDTLVAATQGRGVYTYAFKDPAKALHVAAAALTGAKVKRAGHGLKLSFKRSVRKPVTIDVFQQSIGRRVVGERLVARFKNAKAAFRWNGRANRKGQKVRDGIFMVRFRLKVSNGLIDNRRIDQVRKKGRFSKRPPHYGREGCTLINSFKLERPVFGGTNRKSLGIAYRLLNTAKVTVTVKRGKKVVKRYKARHPARQPHAPAAVLAEGPPAGRLQGHGAREAGWSHHAAHPHRQETVISPTGARKLAAFGDVTYGSSSSNVTGPSLTSSTSMWAPKRPRRAPVRSQKRS